MPPTKSRSKTPQGTSNTNTKNKTKTKSGTNTDSNVAKKQKGQQRKKKSMQQKRSHAKKSTDKIVVLDKTQDMSERRKIMQQQKPIPRPLQQKQRPQDQKPRQQKVSANTSQTQPNTSTENDKDLGPMNKVDPTQENAGGNDDESTKEEIDVVDPHKVKQMGLLEDKQNNKMDLEDIDNMNSNHEMDKVTEDDTKNVVVTENQFRLYLIGKDHSKREEKSEV